MILIPSIIYAFVTLRTIATYRWVNKNRPELSVWNNPHYVNLFWMLVPVIQIIYLIESEEIKFKNLKNS